MAEGSEGGGGGRSGHSRWYSMGEGSEGGGGGVGTAGGTVWQRVVKGGGEEEWAQQVVQYGRG